MRLKTILPALIFLLIFNNVRAQKAEVSTAVENIGGGYNLAYRVMIPHADAELVMKKWVRFLKDNKGKVDSDRDEATAKYVVIRGISSDSLEVSSSIAKKDEGILLIAAFESPSGFINPTDHPEKSRLLEQVLLDFAKSISTGAIDEKAETEDKVLRTKLKEQSRTERNIKRLKENNEKMRKSIADNEKTIEKNEKRIEELKEEISEQEAKIKNTKAKLKEL